MGEAGSVAIGEDAVLVSAIIPTHDRCQELLRCIASLEAQEVQPLEIIVVDDGSTDGTIDAVRRDHPAVKLIPLWTNLGAALAKNLGAARARGAYLWFLDSDSEIPDSGVGRRMVEILADKPGAGAVGGEMILLEDGRREYRIKHSLANGETSTEAVAPDPGPRQVDYLPTCNLMIRSSTFRHLGGFDPGYFYLCEDTELGWRLTALDLSNLSLPSTSVLHHIDQKGRKGDLYLAHRNRLRFALLNLPLGSLLLLPLRDLLSLFAPAKRRALRRGSVKVTKHLPPSLRSIVARPDLPAGMKLALVGVFYIACLAAAYAWNGLFLPLTLARRWRRPDFFAAALEVAAGLKVIE